MYITNNNLTDEMYLQDTNSLVDEMELRVKTKRWIPTEHIQILLDIPDDSHDPNDPKVRKCFYYLVNGAPDCRWIFWLKSNNISKIAEEVEIRTAEDISTPIF